MKGLDVWTNTLKNKYQKKCMKNSMKKMGINLGFWETAHLPLPYANMWEVSDNVGLGEG